jgi:hypothetical protein
VNTPEARLIEANEEAQRIADRAMQRGEKAEAEVERLTEERDRLGAGNKRPVPDFEKCGNCEADAKANCSWDPADGWCCSKCGACDSDE